MYILYIPTHTARPPGIFVKVHFLIRLLGFVTDHLIYTGWT